MPEGSVEAETGALRRPARLGEEVYSVLYGQLMSQKIPPGGRISVDSLVRELGVSQTPIREALSRLEAQGLVVKTHLIGYSAAPQMDRTRLDQLYELRLLLEPFAAERAATSMSDEALARLQRLAAEMAGEETAGANAYGRFARRDAEFHDLVAQGGGNALIEETLNNLHTHVHLFRLFYHARAASEAIAEHADIIAAIAARDGKAAHAAMHRHIERSRTRFMSFFDRQG